MFRCRVLLGLIITSIDMTKKYDSFISNLFIFDPCSETTNTWTLRLQYVEVRKRYRGGVSARGD
jgi:hypothetical protein